MTSVKPTLGLQAGATSPAGRSPDTASRREAWRRALEHALRPGWLATSAARSGVAGDGAGPGTQVVIPTRGASSGPSPALGAPERRWAQARGAPGALACRGSGTGPGAASSSAQASEGVAGLHADEPARCVPRPDGGGALGMAAPVASLARDAEPGRVGAGVAPPPARVGGGASPGTPPPVAMCDRGPGAPASEGDEAPRLDPTLDGRRPNGEAPRAGEAPIRIHAEWSEHGLRAWIGLDADAPGPTLPLLQALVGELRRRAEARGLGLLGVVCNGRSVCEGSADAAPATPRVGTEADTLSQPAATALARALLVTQPPEVP